MKVRSSITKDELFKAFTKYFSIRGWNVTTALSVVSAEDGKNYSIAVIILMIISGLLTLVFFSIGIVFWIFAAAYYIASDRHEAKLIHLEENLFETYTNSDLANKILNEFLSKLEKEGKVTIIKLKPLKPTETEMYEKLLEYYITVWGAGGKTRLEKDIEKLVRKRELERGQAIEELFKEIFR